MTSDDPRPCPRCGTPLDQDVIVCSRCRFVSASSGSLMGKSFRGQDLRACAFGDADLSRADFTDARLDGADLGDCNLFDVVVTNASLDRTRIDVVYASTLKRYQGTPDWSQPRSTLPKFYFLFGTVPLICQACLGERFRAYPGVKFEGHDGHTTTYICLACQSIQWFARALAERHHDG